MDREMQKALELDGEKLRQLTGEDHGPFCPACLGSGVEVFAITVYEPGCGYSHDSTDERICPECSGTGRVAVCPTCGGHLMVGWIDPGEGVRTEPCDCASLQPPALEDEIEF